MMIIDNDRTIERYQILKKSPEEGVVGTSVFRKSSTGGFLRYPRDQWRKVNFCPVKWTELSGKLG